MLVLDNGENEGEGDRGINRKSRGLRGHMHAKNLA